MVVAGPVFEISIPVLNEERSLRQQVKRALFYLGGSSIDHYRIRIVDNGSTDGTAAIGEALAEEYEDVYFSRVCKRGVGLALRTSWLSSDAEFVGSMDLDLSTDLRHLDEAYRMLCYGDVLAVNGSRLLRGSRVVNRTLIREITSRGFNFLVRGLLGVEFTDGMCGFKFYRREALLPVLHEIDNDSWFFETEVLTKLSWSGIRIHEIPVFWTEDRDSRVRIVSLSLSYFRQILKVRREKKFWK